MVEHVPRFAAFDAWKARYEEEDRDGAGRRAVVLKHIETEEAERSRRDSNLATEIAKQLQGKWYNLLGI